MKIINKSNALVLSALSAISLFLQPLNADLSYAQKGMLSDLKFIDSVFEDFYSTAQWKLEWDLPAEIAVIEEAITTEPDLTLKEFHCLIKDLFISAKDYHASVSFYSTETAALPFSVKSAGTRYFFSYLDKDQLPKKFPFSVGDELISFNGVPIHKVVTEIRKQEVGFNYDATDYAMAEMFLTMRLGSLGHLIPKGKVELKGVKKGTKKEVSSVLEWECESEKITMPTKPMQKGRGFKLPTQSKRLAGLERLQKRLAIPQYKALAKLPLKAAGNTGLIGSKKSPQPPIGDVIWEADEDSIFYSYVSVTPAGDIVGYIRIPSYGPDDVSSAVTEFMVMVEIFEEVTDALIIDQLSNPGGYMSYVYELASMLTTQSLNVPKHRIVLTQSDMCVAYEFIDALKNIDSDEEAVDILGTSLYGMAVNLQFTESLLAYFTFIIEEWEAGNRFTKPCHFFGVGPLSPSTSANYTKPILVLVNSLDFSGGDFFPAILQDNNRATIFGTRTAGAGGVLEELMFPNLRGISSIQYTTSIAERGNGLLIENTGVTPDIQYEVSVGDLQNNYAEYVQKVTQTLESLIH